MDIYEAMDYGPLNLEHHGILGMRWGNRKQRIEARRNVLNRAAIGLANEASAYSNEYQKTMANGNAKAAKQARRNAINARAEASNYMLNALGHKMYTKNDLMYAQKHINGDATMKDIHKRMNRRAALGLTALGIMFAASTAADLMYDRRLA